MAVLQRLIWVLLGSTFVVGNKFSSPSKIETRQIPRPGQKGKPVTSNVKRKNNGGDLLLNPLAGPMLPYFDNIQFRSPCLDRRDIKISVDTGSSDFWIDASLWCRCEKERKEASKMCTDIRKQRKYKEYRLQYDDDFEVIGNYMGGELSLYDSDNNEFLLKNIGFVAAYDFKNSPKGPNAMTGSIGLGFTNDQQLKYELADDGGEFQYWSLPEVLERNHNTSSNAFSMWFETTRVDEDFAAKIMFGGYVKNYYVEPLATLKIIGDRNWVDESGGSGGQKIIVQLDEIGHRGKRIFDTCDQSQPVLLDTGSFSIFLPHDAYMKLIRRMGTHQTVENGNRKIAVFDDCRKWEELNESIDFHFGNRKISVPIWNNLVRYPTADEVKSGAYPAIKYPKKQCLTHGIATWPAVASIDITFAMSRKSPNSYKDRRSILGITFLRHAFVVYDLDQKEVNIAPISQKAIDSEPADEFEFDDRFKTHQAQIGFDPVKLRAERCK
ncbi:acid protease [Cucurbitaria berberidis CBS 394.84]|uniref:Acid protease n=1 Tax=Cucurbitaria berberidis CBS 394.84 TaxID=1168544 RepID=A0A9P4GSD1_9PLEO|nr:acid protease [Cucurbitaria berberidis CBS 394.84]KAF1850465.1 acid protease [Cucurbitaria berberidis CBS 394.84]